MLTPDDFLQRLEAKRGKEWMLVGMHFIRSVTIIQSHLSDAVDRTLRNSVTSEKLVGDSFKRLVRLALGVDVLDKREHDALLYLATIRNKWAHEQDIDMDIRKLGPLTATLSPARRQSLKTHVDDYWGHFRHTCDLLCDELVESLSSAPES